MRFVGVKLQEVRNHIRRFRVLTEHFAKTRLGKHGGAIKRQQTRRHTVITQCAARVAHHSVVFGSFESKVALMLRFLSARGSVELLVEKGCFGIARSLIGQLRLLDAPSSAPAQKQGAEEQQD